MPSLPPVTKNLLLACVAVFCLGFLVPLLPLFALWPLDSRMFMPWQLLTYALLHHDVLHLFFNGLMLWMLGADLERLWGTRRYLSFVVVSALAAGVMQLVVVGLMGSRAYTVGASGVVYGLLLAYALSFPRRQFDLVGLLPMLLMMVPLPLFGTLGMVLFVLLMTNRQAVPIPPVPVTALVMVGLLGAISLVMGIFFRSDVAHFAHLGGMLGGWLMMQYWRHYGGRRR